MATQLAFQVWTSMSLLPAWQVRSFSRSAGIGSSECALRTPVVCPEGPTVCISNVIGAERSALWRVSHCLVHILAHREFRRHHSMRFAAAFASDTDANLV